jgi:hypothetical protein
MKYESPDGTATVLMLTEYQTREDETEPGPLRYSGP